VNLESPKIRRNLPGYLRLEEVERLLTQPDVKTPIGLRDPCHAGGFVLHWLACVGAYRAAHYSDLDAKVGLRALYRQR